MLIINVRGTNGSGKSTVAHTLLKEYGFDPAHINDLNTQTPMIDLVHYADKRGKQKIVEGHVIHPLKLCLVGSYKTQCGGADGIPTQPLIKEAVAKAASLGLHVLFEGVIISTLYSGYRQLSKDMRAEGHQYLWVYLDTPTAECIRRIQVRNGGKPIKEDLVRDKVKAIESTRKKARGAGEEVNVTSNELIVPYIKGLIHDYRAGSLPGSEVLGTGAGGDPREEGERPAEAVDG